MKLIIAIIQDEDAGEVISHLNEAEIQVTSYKRRFPPQRQYHHHDRCGRRKSG